MPVLLYTATEMNALASSPGQGTRPTAAGCRPRALTRCPQTRKEFCRCVYYAHFFSGSGSACLLRFHTDRVRPSPGLLEKSVVRSAPGLPKHDLKLSPSTSYMACCFLPLVNPSIIW